MLFIGFSLEVSHLKKYFSQKYNFSPYFLLYQTCMSLFLLLNTKEDTLKNVSDQTVDGTH